MTEEMNTVETTEKELSELLQIRRAKLDELRALGIDPFGKNMTAQQVPGTFWLSMTDKQKRNWTSWLWKSAL